MVANRLGVRHARGGASRVTYIGSRRAARRRARARRPSPFVDALPRARQHGIMSLRGRPTGPALPLRHVPQLDALRALAVTGVMVYHYARVPALGVLAIVGVKLFFVLSGFLITRLLLEARRDVERGGQRRVGALGRFYLRRALRIFPLYYLVVAVLVTVDL